MSLLTSLSSGTTGLASASSELAVVGDNIANANTVGFKSERAAFEDALAQTVVGGQGQIGLGSRLQSVQKILTQGSLTNTGVATDLALQGAGFFEVAGTTNDGRQGTFLTRAGQFTVDNNGFLVNLDGLRVQGYAADNLGNITGTLGDLQVGNASSAPLPTNQVTLQGNLASDTAVGGTFSSSVTVYDSLGATHQVQVTYTNMGIVNGSSTWSWSAAVGATNVGSGSLTYDSSGVSPVTGGTGGSITLPGTGGAANLTASIDFTGISQFAGASATTFVGQNGYGSGQLTSIQIDKTGTIQGIFSNGQTRAIGQVGVARVAAPDQLERTGGNLYALTRESGQAVMGAAGDGGRAFISAGSLEQSNVDIADQFVRMIAAQRNFEANSKTITTADQLLSELIAMKR